MNTTSILREITLKLIESDVTLDLSRMPSFLYFLIPRRKVVKKLLKSPAVLTGSRALSLYKTKGEFILKRKPRDWDFVITREDFLKFCKENKILDIDLSKPNHTSDNSLLVIDVGYGTFKRVFPCLVEVTIVDSLPEFEEVSSIRISKLSPILKFKKELSISAKYEEVREKNKQDLSNILISLY